MGVISWSVGLTLSSIFYLYTLFWNMILTQMSDFSLISWEGLRVIYLVSQTSAHCLKLYVAEFLNWVGGHLCCCSFHVSTAQCWIVIEEGIVGLLDRDTHQPRVWIWSCLFFLEEQEERRQVLHQCVCPWRAIIVTLASGGGYLVDGTAALSVPWMDHFRHGGKAGSRA